jgi:hypothetical protein
MKMGADEGSTIPYWFFSMGFRKTVAHTDSPDEKCRHT